MLLRAKPPHARLEFRANALKYSNLQKLKHALNPTQQINYPMKKFLPFIALVLFTNLAQAQYSSPPVLIGPDEYARLFTSSDADEGIVNIFQGGGDWTNIFMSQMRDVEAKTLSRTLFDNDEGIEYAYSTPSQWRYVDEIPSTWIVEFDNKNRETHTRYEGLFVGIIENASGSYMILEKSMDGEVNDEYVRLPGRTQEYRDRTNRTVRVDTVYQIDTVRELITERIFTSDTVYINETITLAGDVNTLVINRTVTTRDTVYNFTEHTEYITRVDSLYLLGGDYLADLNSVTSLENQLEVEKLGNPYPNPASITVSIDYVTAVPTSNMFLGVYDNQGRRVEQFPVKPSHTITFDVSDWAPGVYVYMIWSPVGVSSTKRLVVQ